VADNSVPPTNLPPHIEDAIRTMTRLHADHYRAATLFQRAVESATNLLCRPRFIGLLTVAVAGWIVFNSFARTMGWHAVDPPPFSWLAGTLTLLSLYMVVLILITQRHDDELSQRREQLILELAILGEQKMAKVIELLEESRRDNPLIHDRVDQEADAMAQSADPQSVLKEIAKTHAKAEQIKIPPER
jgi:uncharacterized membrane protein